MKLWKILFATTIALILMCAVAMADTCETCDMSNSWTTTKPATCTETGLQAQRYCIHSNCDNYNIFVNETEVAALGHNWDGNSAKHVAPTCTAEGYWYNECTRCGAVDKVVREKIAHTLKTSNQLSTPATCTEGGEAVQVCEVCYTVVTTATAATGHNWSSISGKPATCTENGYTMHQKCTACGATNGGAVIPARGHDWKLAATVDATCTTDGYLRYECNTCKDGKKEDNGTATGHDFSKYLHSQAATCTEEGWDKYGCADCDTGEREYKNVVPATGHDFSVLVDAREAACETDGYERYKCADCEERQNVVVAPATGHDFSILTDNTVDPSCTAEGKRVYACANGCTKTYEVKIDKIAHNYAETEWVTDAKATCMQGGTEKNHCTMCNGAWIVRETAALGHDLSEERVWKLEPTCLEAGVMVKLCEREGCGYEVTTIVEAYGHKYRDDIVAAATCELVGMKHIYCDRGCGLLEANVIIPKLGHKGEVTEYVAPTCTTEGKQTIKCTTCSKTVTETLAKLAHTYEWVTVADATPTSSGKKEYKCDCGDVADVKVVKYTKWYYNNTMTSFGPTTKELVGGSDWYRVTPVDVSVDGVYTYDLIASNKYVVGTVTITVNAGVLTVNYDAKYDVEVKGEDLLIYASKADLATGTAVTANVGAAINVAETFGADTKVLVSLILTGNYNAAGKEYIDTDAVSALLVNVD